MINLAEDGSFKLDMSFFNYAVGLTMTNKKFENLFGGTPRKPESDLTQKHMDIAASIQKVIEEIIVKIAKSIREETKEKLMLSRRSGSKLCGKFSFRRAEDL